MSRKKREEEEEEEETEEEGEEIIKKLEVSPVKHLSKSVNTLEVLRRYRVAKLRTSKLAQVERKEDQLVDSEVLVVYFVFSDPERKIRRFEFSSEKYTCSLMRFHDWTVHRLKLRLSSITFVETNNMVFGVSEQGGSSFEVLSGKTKLSEYIDNELCPLYGDGYSPPYFANVMFEICDPDEKCQNIVSSLRSSYDDDRPIMTKSEICDPLRNQLSFPSSVLPVLKDPNSSNTIFTDCFTLSYFFGRSGSEIKLLFDIPIFTPFCKHMTARKMFQALHWRFKRLLYHRVDSPIENPRDIIGSEKESSLNTLFKVYLIDGLFGANYEFDLCEISDILKAGNNTIFNPSVIEVVCPEEEEEEDDNEKKKKKKKTVEDYIQEFFMRSANLVHLEQCIKHTKKRKNKMFPVLVVEVDREVVKKMEGCDGSILRNNGNIALGNMADSVYGSKDLRERVLFLKNYEECKDYVLEHDEFEISFEEVLGGSGRRRSVRVPRCIIFYDQQLTGRKRCKEEEEEVEGEGEL